MKINSDPNPLQNLRIKEIKRIRLNVVPVSSDILLVFNGKALSIKKLFENVLQVLACSAMKK